MMIILLFDNALRLLQSVPTAAVPCETHIQLHADPSAKILQIVLAVAVALISLTTFTLGYRKRIKERRANWYQKVVVDACLPKIFEFFDKTQTDLANAAAECARCTGQNRKTLSSKVTAAIAGFSEELIPVKDFVTERLIIFDEKDAAKFEARMLQLQDDVSNWFSEFALKKRSNPREVQDILLITQREILRLLYESEFTSF